MLSERCNSALSPDGEAVSRLSSTRVTPDYHAEHKAKPQVVAATCNSRWRDASHSSDITCHTDTPPITQEE